MSGLSSTYAWVKVFRIIPEFRILRLTFHRKSASKWWIRVCLRTIDHLNLKLWIFSGHTASFKIGVSKVQDFRNYEFSPMHMHGWKLKIAIHFKSWHFEIYNLKLKKKLTCYQKLIISNLKALSEDTSAVIICTIQHFELNILNSPIILKTFKKNVHPAIAL